MNTKTDSVTPTGIAYKTNNGSGASGECTKETSLIIWAGKERILSTTLETVVHHVNDYPRLENELAELRRAGQGVLDSVGFGKDTGMAAVAHWPEFETLAFALKKGGVA